MDFNALVDTIAPGIQYDFVLDAVGKAKTSKMKAACKHALTPNGMYVSIDGEKLMLDANRLDRITAFIDAAHPQLVVDRSYPLEDIFEAHRYVEHGHKSGGVAILVR